MCPRRSTAEPVTARSRALSTGRAERSVRRFLLVTALVLSLLALAAFVIPLLLSLPPRAIGAVSWRPTAIGAAVVLGLLLREQRGAWIMLTLGVCLIEVPMLVTQQLSLATLATFSQTLLIGLVVGFVGTVMLRLGRAADLAWAGRERAAAAAAAAAGASAARARAAALVHDEVLQALNLAASPLRVDRQRLAEQATRVRGMLHEASTDEQPLSLDAALREDTREVDPDAAFETLEEAASRINLPPTVSPVIRSAVRQALHNSLLHAGQRAQRRVTVEHDSAGLRVTVADDGTGFDLARVPTRRLGLRTTSQALRSVGGQMTVESGSGSGTRVTVQWPAASPAEQPALAPRIGELPLVRTGGLVTAAAFALVQTALAILATATAEPRWAPPLTLALLLAPALILLNGSRSRLGAGRTALVLCLTGGAVATGLSAAPFEVGELWFAGAAAFILTALSFRGRPAAAATGVLLLSGLLVASGILSLAPPFLIVSVSVRPLGVTLFAVGLTLAIVALRASIAREVARTEAESARESWERSARAELAARAAEVRDLVDEVLAEIAQADALTAQSRARAAALEGHLRDRVRAGRLAVESLLTAAMRARERGVDVLLLDDLEGELPEGFDLERAAIGLAAACDDATERVTVRLLPAGRSTVLSLVVDETPVTLAENH